MADEYIRKADAKDALQEKVFHNLTDEFYGAMQVLDELEPADVVQVRHGKWINEYWHSEKVRKCSVCRITQTVNVYNGKVKFNYCPYCGAKMDAQGEE